MTTKAQRETQERNFLIKRLRGVYALGDQLNSHAIMAGVEVELAKLNAESEQSHRKKTK